MVQELQSLGLAASPKNPHPRQLTYADLAELAYLQAVVKVPSQDLCASLSHQCCMGSISPTVLSSTMTQSFSTARLESCWSGR